MYERKKVINGVLCYKTTPKGKFRPYTLEQLTFKIMQIQKERDEAIDRIYDFKYEAESFLDYSTIPAKRDSSIHPQGVVKKKRCNDTQTRETPNGVRGISLEHSERDIDTFSV